MITFNITPATASAAQILNAITRVARIQEATESVEMVRNTRDDLGTLSWHANRLGIAAQAQLAAIREGKAQAQKAMSA